MVQCIQTHKLWPLWRRPADGTPFYAFKHRPQLIKQNIIAVIFGISHLFTPKTIRCNTLRASSEKKTEQRNHYMDEMLGQDDAKALDFLNRVSWIIRTWAKFQCFEKLCGATRCRYILFTLQPPMSSALKPSETCRCSIILARLNETRCCHQSVM